ncbi:MAG: hypothetical protein GXO86_01145, partial [Chlorobi bacterium]|nr:hypothetical protein [Chlorobiota bacterium]
MKKFTNILTAFLFAAFFAWNMNAMAQTYFITVVQPNGGESWAVGTSHLISWKDNLTTPVKILLSNGGAYAVIPGATSVTGSTWTWNIPAGHATGTTFKIKVESKIDNTIHDESDAVFSITAHTSGGTIHVVQPDVTGISWAVGTSHLISWTDNLTEPVKIELSTDGGSNYTTLKASATGSTWTWNISSTQTTSTTSKIKISSTTDATIYDVSDNNFSITAHTSGGTINIVQPDISGISWAVGTSHLISWTDNLTEPVKIQLSLNGGSPTTL